MKFFEGLTAIPDSFGPSAVTIGKFDGVHLGHRDVIGQLRRLAADASLATVVVTFDRHPQSVIDPQNVPGSLVSNDDKAALLEAEGVDACLMVEFTTDFSHLTPEEFVHTVLVEKLHAKVVLTGADFRFGINGSGDIEALREFGERFGFEVAQIEDVVVDPDGDALPSVGAQVGRRVSSTWIRELLAEGRVRDAARLLGRLPTVRSIVVSGEQRGRELGYPTANLDPLALVGTRPRDGVYAAWAVVEGTRYGAAVSVGNNPTFDGVPQHQIEAHLLDQSRDLYGKEIELQWVDYLRPMNAFTTVDDLVVQLRADEVAIRGILAAEPS